MLIHHSLEKAARNTPDKVALVCGSQRYTYGRVNALADELAAAILRAGARSRDRIIVYMDNCAEAVVSIYAILKADCIFVPLNPDTKARKLAYVLMDCGARIVLSHQNKLETINQAYKLIQPRFPTKYGIIRIDNSIDSNFGRERTQASTSPVGCPSEVASDLAALIYTSGTTGKPKGVMSAHCNMLAAIESITQYLGNVQSDIVLNVLPLSFDYGLYQMLMMFHVGGTLVLEKSFAYPHNLLKLIAAEGVTGLPVVPTMAAMLLRLNKLSDYDFRSLRYMTSTGAHFPVPHIRELQMHFPHLRIFCMYGLTECKRVSYLPPERLSDKAGSVGIPMANVNVKIVDRNNREVGAGAIGELVVCGPNVMRGYWNDPEASDLKFRKADNGEERCLYSGDLFKKDAEGYLYFVSRTDDLFKVRGERVSPKEIESILLELPGVSEAAVIGIQDPFDGHRIKAVILLKDECALTEQGVLKYCADNLEAHMVPKTIEITRTLPRSNNMKLDKAGLGHANA